MAPLYALFSYCDKLACHGGKGALVPAIVQGDDLAEASVYHRRMEIWDVYDAQRRLTGRTMVRDNPIPQGDYHLVVEIGIINLRGELLITKRHPAKSYYPLFWETSGGSALAGETSLQGALREVREEIGIELNPQKGFILASRKSKTAFFEQWIFEQEINLADTRLQDGEVCDIQYVNYHQLRKLQENNELIPYRDAYFDFLKRSLYV